MVTDDGGDDQVTQVTRLLNYATILTTTQWLDLHKSKIQSPEQEFWFGWFTGAIDDWNRFLRSPTRTNWKNASDIPSWVLSNSFTIVAETVSEIYHIEEERFRQGFIKWLRLDKIKTDPRYKHLVEVTNG